MLSNFKGRSASKFLDAQQLNMSSCIFFCLFLFVPSVLTKLNTIKVDLTKPYACPKPNH